MKTKKVLDEEIQNLIGLGNIVQSYEEIAASRIKRSRDSVLRNRSYMADIIEIFQEVLTTYRKEVQAMMSKKKKKDLKDFSFLNKNGKTLYLLVSANTGLYGNIVRRTFDLFIAESRKANADKAIIGRLGLSLWQQTKIPDKYFYFDFPDQDLEKDQLKKMLDVIVSYEKVIVFYGQFHNLVTQEPTFSDISGNPISPNQASEQVRYYFEPSLDKVFEFFERQIFSSIFEQTLRESQLAKIASRLTSLDSATQNITRELERNKAERTRISHYIQNKKQFETFSSKALWNK